MSSKSNLIESKEIHNNTRDIYINNNTKNTEFNSNINDEINQSNYYQINQLINEIENKNKEIDKLNVIIDSLSPVPGLDQEKIKRMIINKAVNEGIDIDYRDSKIVSLAKKCRNLTIQLNKEKSDNIVYQKNIQELNIFNQSLQEEIILLSNNINSKSNTKSNKVIDESNDIKETKDNTKHLNKTIEELRIKLAQSKEEIKNLKVILSKEIGDNSTIEQASDNDWKGRAQQIVMLKNKIKRLESQLHSSDNKPINEVNSKAESALHDIDIQKKLTIDSISEDYKKLSSEYNELEKKYTSSKSRIKILENDTQKYKQQIQVILDKSNSDDELIELQQKEIEKLQKKLKESTTVITQSKETTTRENKDDLISKLNNEIQRLNRLCKEQAQQLNTQDAIITELRGNIYK